MYVFPRLFHILKIGSYGFFDLLDEGLVVEFFADQVLALVDRLVSRQDIGSSHVNFEALLAVLVVDDDLDRLKDAVFVLAGCHRDVAAVVALKLTQNKRTLPRDILQVFAILVASEIGLDDCGGLVHCDPLGWLDFAVERSFGIDFAVVVVVHKLECLLLFTLEAG